MFQELAQKLTSPKEGFRSQMKKYISFLIFISFVFSFNAIGQSVGKGEIAGYYLASVQMAGELKKSQCGKFLIIENSQINLDSAIKDVSKYLTPSERKAFLSEITPKFINESSQFFREMYKKIPVNKCKTYIDENFWAEYNKSFEDWKNIRGMPNY